MADADRAGNAGKAFAFLVCVFVVLHATTHFVLTRLVFLAGLGAIAAVILGWLPGWRKRLHPADWAWAIALVVFAAYIHLHIGIEGGVDWQWAKRTRLHLYGLPLWLVATQFRLPFPWLAAATTVTAAIVFTWTAVQKFGFGVSRAAMVFEWVEGGLICATVASLGLVLFGMIQGRWRAAVFSGALLAMAAAIFTGSRGPQFLLPAACLAGLGHAWPALRRRERAGAGVAVFLFWVFFLSVPQAGLTPRWVEAWEGFAAHREGRTIGDPVGARLDWNEAGLEELAKGSLFGIKHSGWLRRQSELIAAGRIAPHLEGHRDIHNQWFDVGVKGGWAGLVLVSLILFLPLWRFGRAWRRGRFGRDYRAYALCGFLMALGMNIVALTNVSIWMVNSVMLFVPMAVVLSAQLVRIENEAD